VYQFLRFPAGQAKFKESLLNVQKRPRM